MAIKDSLFSGKLFLNWGSLDAAAADTGGLDGVLETKHLFMDFRVLGDILLL
jgi:hypothetical protein